MRLYFRGEMNFKHEHRFVQNLWQKCWAADADANDAADADAAAAVDRAAAALLSYQGNARLGVTENVYNWWPPWGVLKESPHSDMLNWVWYAHAVTALETAWFVHVSYSGFLSWKCIHFKV